MNPYTRVVCSKVQKRVIFSFRRRALCSRDQDAVCGPSPQYIDPPEVVSFVLAGMSVFGVLVLRSDETMSIRLIVGCLRTEAVFTGSIV